MLISRASFGGLKMSKKMIAPQTKITIVKPNGITDQKTSSQKAPSMDWGRSSSARRRYLTAKKIIMKKINVTKKTETATRKNKSASTRGAMVEACSGKRGNPRFMLQHSPEPAICDHVHG